VSDLVPVGGFLTGRLISHVALGAVLGLAGGAIQLSASTRAWIQITAGVVMLVLALELLGVKAVRGLAPRLPATWGRQVRQRTRSRGASGPWLLGLGSVLLPCGITLSMEVLAIASGSALSGAAIMGVFVIGTPPLFAVLGYVARRSATALGAGLACWPAQPCSSPPSCR